MSYLNIKKVAIRGVSVCVPREIEEEIESPTFESKKAAADFIASTGIERHRIAPKGVTASDLGVAAAEKLIADLGWDKSTIDCLLFATQTPDYILPATSCIMQDRLGLSNECYTLDISLGCSGWVYGMSVVCSLISANGFRRGILICGDTLSRTNSRRDKTSWPLFSDATSVTAVEFDENAKEIYFNFGTDGSGWKAIYIPEGGYRNLFNERSLDYEQIDPGVCKNKLHGIMDGMDVFSFSISRAPKSLKKLAEYYSLDLQNTDYLLLHQANRIIDDKIASKLKIDLNKVPYSLKDFGNTSGASIPMTMVNNIREGLSTRHLKLVGCGFGVGLSWGSVYFETDKICCPNLIEY
ncbi:MAG: ketoacyl-ACP synthase III [Bacteroidales bacterium]|nr:ketoacyl-ACP synthase III [Bacteroidales bacterium]